MSNVECCNGCGIVILKGSDTSLCVNCEAGMLAMQPRTVDDIENEPGWITEAGIALMMERDAMRKLADAGYWVLHVVSGVGKAGGQPEDGEDLAAFDALKEAVERARGFATPSRKDPCRPA